MNDQLLTVEQVAERLHCKPGTVRVLVREKKLRAGKIAGRWLIPESAFTEYLAAHGLAVVRRRQRMAS